MYPNREELESVLRMIESFPPLVFAGEARKLEEHLADAAFGKALRVFFFFNLSDYSAILCLLFYLLSWGV